MSDLIRLNTLCKSFVRRNDALSQKKLEVKTLTEPMKEEREAIMEIMKGQNIPSCASSGFVFTIKSSVKKPTVTTKVLLQITKEFIGEDAFQELQQRITRYRESSSTTVHTLTTRAMKDTQPAPAHLGTGVSDNDEGDDETVDDLFA